jgi:hypothetical protein
MIKVTHVITPKRDILTEGFRLDQMYVKANAREDDKKGMVRRGDIVWL